MSRTKAAVVNTRLGPIQPTPSVAAARLRVLRRVMISQPVASPARQKLFIWLAKFLQRYVRVNPGVAPGDQLDATSRLITTMSEGFCSIRTATYIRRACSPLGKVPDFGCVKSARNSLASDV